MLTVADLRDLRARHERASTAHEALLQAHEDRGELLALAVRLADALHELASRETAGRCPLCGDPECSAPLLEELGRSRTPAAIQR